MPHRIIRNWCTGRWSVGCYIWYSEEGPGRAAAPPSPLLAVPNVTAHPSAASAPITVLLYDGPLLCGFNVAIKGLNSKTVFYLHLSPFWSVAVLTVSDTAGVYMHFVRYFQTMALMTKWMTSLFREKKSRSRTSLVTIGPPVLTFFFCKCVLSKTRWWRWAKSTVWGKRQNRSRRAGTAHSWTMESLSDRRHIVISGRSPRSAQPTLVQSS